jgi:hypothetical protein
MLDPYGEHPSKQLEKIVMKSLGNTTELAGAMAHPIGREFFKTLITLMEEKIILIYQGKDSEDDRAMLRVCRIIGGEWKKILDKHTADVNTIVGLQNSKAK